MKKTMSILLWTACALTAITIAGCQFTSPPNDNEASLKLLETQLSLLSETASAKSTDVPTETIPDTLTVPATEALTETSTPVEEQAPTATATLEAPAATVECAEEICIENGTFWLLRPIGPEGRDTINPANRFGEYQRATKDAHHGADFLNSLGTPVRAAADGVVLVTGDDSQVTYGLRLNTYGNLVILEHNLPGMGNPIYTLYAHLSNVLVSKGEPVEAGQVIGEVGMSGNISGSILHFEVRHKENAYQNVRNPELWLEPLSDADGQPYGALAGRILDAEGNFVHVDNIVLERLAGPGLPAMDQLYLKTYASDHLSGQSPWKENFAVGDLPAGSYQISFWLNGMQQRIVEVESGKLTVVTIQLE